MTLKNILVPIDFSDCSNNALNNAIDLAQRSGAKLTLLNCYTLHLPATEVTIDLEPILASEYEKRTEKSFKHLRKITPELEHVPYTEIIKVSFVNDGIQQTAQEIDAELIVMGTKGEQNNTDALLGSNTYHIIKKSKVPVLVIPEGAKFKLLQKVLFAADFKHIEDMSGLDIIKSISILFKAKVEILHVGHGWSELGTRQTAEASAIVDYFDQTYHSYHFIKKEIDVEDAIDNHLKTHHNGLLVLIARKHYFPGSLFQKKVTRNTVMHTKLPLLIIPEIR